MGSTIPTATTAPKITRVILSPVCETSVAGILLPATYCFRKRLRRIRNRVQCFAAGLPIYLAVFGRDTLTAAWQAGMVSTDLMRGTLPELARRQSAVVDNWRDEQPGKMLHQADTGPLATLGFNPLARYYGSITTPGFIRLSFPNSGIGQATRSWCGCLSSLR